MTNSSGSDPKTFRVEDYQLPKAGRAAMPDLEKLQEIFRYHAPEGDQPARYERLRSKALELAEVILTETPRCADQSAAIRHLREAVMTANAAIALKGLV